MQINIYGEKSVMTGWLRGTNQASVEVLQCIRKERKKDEVKCKLIKVGFRL